MKNRINFYQTTKQGSLIFLINLNDEPYAYTKVPSKGKSVLLQTAKKVVPFELVAMEKGILTIRISDNLGIRTISMIISLLFSKKTNFFRVKEIHLLYRDHNLVLNKGNYKDEISIITDDELEKDLSSIKAVSKKRSAYILERILDEYMCYDIFPSEFEVKFIKFSSNALIFKVRVANKSEFSFRITKHQFSELSINICNTLENYGDDAVVFDFFESFFKEGSRFYGISSLLLKDEDLIIHLDKENCTSSYERYKEMCDNDCINFIKERGELYRKARKQMEDDVKRMRKVLIKVENEIDTISLKSEFRNTTFDQGKRSNKFLIQYAKFIEYILKRCDLNLLPKTFVIDTFFKLNVLPEYRLNMKEFKPIQQILLQIWEFSYILN